MTQQTTCGVCQSLTSPGLYEDGAGEVAIDGDEVARIADAYRAALSESRVSP